MPWTLTQSLNMRTRTDVGNSRNDYNLGPLLLFQWTVCPLIIFISIIHQRCYHCSALIAPSKNIVPTLKTLPLFSRDNSIQRDTIVRRIPTELKADSFILDDSFGQQSNNFPRGGADDNSNLSVKNNIENNNSKNHVANELYNYLSTLFPQKILHSLQQGYRQRRAADPAFFAKSILEIITAASTHFVAEVTRRGW